MMLEKLVYLLKANGLYLWIGETREEAEAALAEVFVDDVQIIRATVKGIKE